MFTYKDTEYTKESLDAMSDEALLVLRNQIAEELGVASVRAFKDHAMAVDQTWRTLEKRAEKALAQTVDPSQPKTPKVKKEKVNKTTTIRGLAKSAEAKIVKRPTRVMFSTLMKIGTHDGTQDRAHRWPNYKDGMTIVDVIETEGTEPWDVHNWVAKGLMSLTEPTDAEHAERKAAWYAKHNLVDPDVAKVNKAKEREEAKAKREAEALEKKAAADAAKAAAAEAKVKAAASESPTPATA
jgi:hypothetical protein